MPTQLNTSKKEIRRIDSREGLERIISQGKPCICEVPPKVLRENESNQWFLNRCAAAILRGSTPAGDLILEVHPQ